MLKWMGPAVLYLISIVVPFLLCAGGSFSLFSELHTQINTRALIYLNRSV
uniref:Uncharacterized protein n=1 Tax=Anguilla anguilla TaxID=7936 RepID=A0A0E9XZ20_ANGAN